MLNYFMERSGVTGGWLLLAFAGIAVVSYLLGCCNGAILVSRIALKDDIRQHGSGNAGLTNFCRTNGGWLSVMVIVIDVIKMVIAMVLSWYVFSRLSPALVDFGKYWSGLFCILGHMFPCTFQFRGGKGILSGGTMAILMDWRVALVVWGGFLILAIATKYVSLGSCSTGVTFPIISALVYRDWYITVLAIIMGALIIFKHRGNIVRLIKGTESKFSMKKKDKKAPPEEKIQ